MRDSRMAHCGPFFIDSDVKKRKQTLLQCVFAEMGNAAVARKTLLLRAQAAAPEQEDCLRTYKSLAIRTIGRVIRWFHLTVPCYNRVRHAAILPAKKTRKNRAKRTQIADHMQQKLSLGE